MKTANQKSDTLTISAGGKGVVRPIDVKRAIEGREAISTIVLDETVRSIAPLAFANLDTLKKIILPEGIRFIANRAFMGCKGLEIDRFPNSLCAIDRSAFLECGDLEEKIIVSDDGRTLFAYPASRARGEIVIDDGIEVIARGAFHRCDEMTALRLPSSVHVIGNGACARCTRLASVDLPPALERIGANGFSYCEELKAMTIPEGVTSIGKKAFAECDSLTSMTILGGITAIEQETFRGCRKLKAIQLPESLREIGCDAFDFCVDLKKIVLPKRPVKIHPWAFIECDGIFDRPLLSRDGKRLYKWTCQDETAVIPDGVEEIAERALENNTRITSIVLPASVRAIGDRAFACCYRLREATMPETLGKLGAGIFYRCHKLEKVRIPQGLRLLPAKTFYDCRALRNVTLPDSIRKIGTEALYGCGSLRKLHLPECLQLLGYGALQGVDESCYELPQGYWETKMEWLHGPNGNPAIRALATSRSSPSGDERTVTEVSWPYGTTKILENLLAGCDLLEKAEIPRTVETIENGAFNGCTALEGIDLHEGLHGIGNSAFYDCKKAFRVLHIPSTLRTIGWGAFGHCDSVTAIEFANGIQSIGPGAFSNCNSIRWLALPMSVRRIAKGAFSLCDKLEEIALPEGLSSLGPRVFAFCPRLTELVIPEGIKRISVTEEIENPAEPDENGIPRGLLPLNRSPTPNELIHYILLLSTWERRLDGKELCERFRCFINDEEDPIDGTLPNSFSFSIPVNEIEMAIPFLRVLHTKAGEEYFDELQAFEKRYQMTKAANVKEITFLNVRLDTPDKAYQTQAMRRELKISEAFLGDSSVRRLVLPDSLRALNEPFFVGCDSLEELRVHRDTEIGKGFRAACDKKGVRIVMR